MEVTEKWVEQIEEQRNQYIIDNYNDMSISQMARKLHVGDLKIHKIICELVEKGILDKKPEIKLKPKLINWNKVDPYILENYNKMTIKEIANNLDIKYTTLYSRVNKFRKEGKIGYKEVVSVPVKSNLLKIDLLDGNLTIGRKYKITQLNRDGKKGKGGNEFIGVMEEKYKHYYLFRNSRGIRECFLKKDFVIGEYGIEEVR